jgi:hypothetical protein
MSGETIDIAGDRQEGNRTIATIKLHLPTTTTEGSRQGPSSWG